MRKAAILLYLLSYNIAYSESIQKWVDDAGQVHYGDTSPPSSAISEQKIKVFSSFDESSYKAGIKRNSILFKEVKQIEKREAIRKKIAEKRLNDYYSYLDKKKKLSETTKVKKRRLRDKERNRTSIKLKRTKQSKPPVDKQKTSRLH